ncbi:MAG: hypothetical protein RLZZ241_2587 [Bacteroidota bacterium]
MKNSLKVICQISKGLLVLLIILGAHNSRGNAANSKKVLDSILNNALTATDLKSDYTTSVKNLKAFPTAFGGGAYASGGRGKPVYIVRNLYDRGEGSLRWALEQANQSNGGTIVFTVSGTIVLKSWLKISSSNLTIAGQTAPKGGITLSGTKIKIEDVNNLIIRYLRIRPVYGDYDALELINVKQAILDHLSLSWGGDETISLRGDSDNITFQRLLIAEGKTGSLFGDSDDPALCENLSFINSLFFNISHRTPNVSSNGRVDVINNVIFNWQYRLSRVQGATKLNHRNNYYALAQNTDLSNRLNASFKSHKPAIFTGGNYIDHGMLKNPQADNWFLWREFENGLLKSTLPKSLQTPNPYPILGPLMPLLAAQQAFSNVGNNVGCNRYLADDLSSVSASDAIDLNYLKTVQSGDPKRYIPYKMTSKGETFTQGPAYIAFHQNKNSEPTGKRPTKWDADQDGMPDAWERKMGFNPNFPDATMDHDGNGYTNLEEFLNSIAE